MNRIGDVVRVALSTAIVIAGLCYVGQTAIAQNSTPAAQDQMQQPDNQKPAAETKTFAGKIVKAGNTLVLSDAEGQTTYKLDDQQKAKAVRQQRREGDRRSGCLHWHDSRDRDRASLTVV